jgi:2-polyprenyl-3-methyl-5-hydroxy-6-metoxy-1,4-benzoquinol methylase
MYERLTKCPLCKSGLFINHIIVEDKAISKESFIICACKHCDLWFTNPRPDAANSGQYYSSDRYISHQNQTKGLTGLIYHLVRRYTLRQKLAWINSRYPKKGRILDFGCGIGHFVKTCQANGWEAVGFEPNPTAANIAKEDQKISLLPDLKALGQQKKFDVITLFHVLEHVHSLNKTLKLLLDRLKKRGLLFIAVPNREAADATAFKEHWAAWDVPRHLYHFNLTSMQYLAERHDCRITEILPMKFDSYYVSLLSHQYLDSPNRLIKAVKAGYQSNQLAKKNANNYSSLLFVLKKK